MIDNFLKELEEIKDNFDWCLEDITCGTQCIRGTIKKEVCGTGCCTGKFCPITAVYRIRDGRTEPPDCAAFLKVSGLSEEERADIMVAADYIVETPLRIKIMEILGLKDE